MFFFQQSCLVDAVNILMVKMRLSVALFVIIPLLFPTSSQNLYSDEESIDQCTIHASEHDQTSLDTDQDKYDSEACGAVVKCHPNKMSISLSKSSLLGVDREDLRLLDSNCTATDNNTHFVLTTTLIGCSTSSRHTNNTVVYSNMVRQVLPPTAVITRAPEVRISFSCHYSKYGAVSTGAITSGKGQGIREAAGHGFTSNKNVCWKSRFLSYFRNRTCPAK